MDKRIRTGIVNFEMLSDASNQRIHTLFSVAQKKSILTWNEGSLASAELILFDNKDTKFPLKSNQCLAFIGEKTDMAQAFRPSRAFFQLAPMYTVSQLLDLLDLAAVKLLAARESTGKAVRESDKASSYIHKLKRWVVLPTGFEAPEYVRAMALMTLGGVTLEDLYIRSSLQEEQGRALLNELGKQNALMVTLASPSQKNLPSAPATHEVKKSAGLLLKLFGWLSEKRSAPGKQK